MIELIAEHYDINYFLLRGTSILAISGSQLIDLYKNEVLIEVDSPLNDLSLHANDHVIYISDIYGESKKYNSGQVIDFEREVYHLFENGQYISHDRNPDRTALFDSTGELIWQLNFVSLIHISNEDVLIFIDGTNRKNQIILAISRESGEKLWVKEEAKIREKFKLNFRAVRLIGFYKDLVIVATTVDRVYSNLLFLNKHTGDPLFMIPEFQMKQYFEDGFDSTMIKLDRINSVLVQPRGSFNLMTKSFTINKISDHEFGNKLMYYPFEFSFDEHRIYCGRRTDENGRNNSEAMDELVIVNRLDNSVVHKSLINSLKKMRA